MRATTIHAPFDIRVESVPEPRIHRPGDAIVRVRAACVCGSDLWPYRGYNDITPGSRIGHEFVGIVEQVGDEVQTLRPGQFVISPFAYSDGTCPRCRAGVHTSCERGGYYGSPDGDGLPVDGGQGEWLRVPLADGTLVATPQVPDDDQLADLLALSDVMATGWHCATGAAVGPGSSVAVVGDGAVGLCAVLSAKLKGATTIIAMSRHEPRQAIATEFGATHIVAERGDAAVTAVAAITDGLGVDCALECVGTDVAMTTAFALARPGGRVGFVGVPHGVTLPIGRMFSENIGLGGGVAPVRAYLPELRDRVLAGQLHPGRVFDLTLPLAQAPEAYAAMHERRAVKALLLP